MRFDYRLFNETRFSSVALNVRFYEEVFESHWRGIETLYLIHFSLDVEMVSIGHKVYLNSSEKDDMSQP